MTSDPFPPAVPPRPRRPLAVGVRVGAFPDEAPPAWCAALVRDVEAHPALELRALVRAPDASGRPDPALPAPVAAERLVQALLRGIDRPLHPDAARAPAPPMPPARGGADALAGCDVVLVLEGDGPARRRGPGSDPRLAPDARCWRLGSRRVAADIEAALLAGLDVGELVLLERRGRTAQGAPERVHAVHALPAQTFSRRDRASAAFGALPAFVTSALARVALGIEEPAADPDRLAACARLRLPGAGGRGNVRAVARRRLRAALRLALRQAAARVRDRFSEERWELAWHPDPTPVPVPSTDGPSGDPSGTPSGTPSLDVLLARPVAAWRPLLVDPGRLRADPFALAGPDGIDLWFEDLPTGSAHAHLAHARFPPGLDPGEAPAAHAVGSALESAHHLSYPFVFEHDGARLMVPETGRAGRVELWCEDGSPRRWAFERVLLDGIDATDTTLLRRDGRWWLFTSAMSHPAVDERDLLLLYHADALDGAWTAHPANPVVRGVEGARMAGALFELDGALVRPSQYGARRYGHGLNLNRVDALDAERYAETFLGRIVPDGTDGWLGLHALSRAGGVAFADRLRRRPRSGPAGLAGRAAARLVRGARPRERGKPGALG